MSDTNIIQTPENIVVATVPTLEGVRRALGDTGVDPDRGFESDDRSVIDWDDRIRSVGSGNETPLCGDGNETTPLESEATPPFSAGVGSPASLPAGTNVRELS